MRRREEDPRLRRGKMWWGRGAASVCVQWRLGLAPLTSLAAFLPLPTSFLSSSRSSGRMKACRGISMHTSQMYDRRFRFELPRPDHHLDSCRAMAAGPPGWLSVLCFVLNISRLRIPTRNSYLARIHASLSSNGASGVGFWMPRGTKRSYVCRPSFTSHAGTHWTTSSPFSFGKCLAHLRC